MVHAVPAQALEYGLSSWLICADSREAAEVGARYMPLEPAGGATVMTGTPVTFSGESSDALTFNVASSEALLSSPDIDSAIGSQAGAFYRFASTRATVTARTIYWTASFTFTPTDCEGPSTFTTPVRALAVISSEAELMAAKRRQEEAAAVKRREEEAAAASGKKGEAVITGSVSLDGSTITVRGDGMALVKLACTGIGECDGKLTLTGEVPRGKGKPVRARTKTKSKTEIIGTAGFSIPSGETASVEVALNAEGRTLVGVARGQRLSADLTIVKSSPAPAQALAENVRLVEVKAASPKRG